MLNRFDAAFSSQRAFVANASRELRTPLTLMRTAIDVTIDKPSRTSLQPEMMAEKIRPSVDQPENIIVALLLERPVRDGDDDCLSELIADQEDDRPDDVVARSSLSDAIHDGAW